MTQKVSVIAAAALAAPLVLGCDSSASDDYRGKPLATINGLAVLAQPAPAPPPLDAVLVWLAFVDGDEVRVTAERAPVTGTFPSEFSLQLPQPPPARAQTPLGDAKVSSGMLMAVKKGAIQPGEELTGAELIAKPEGTVQGLSDKEGVIHLDRDLPAGDPRSIMMGGITKAGHYVMQLVTLPPGEAARRAAACRQVLGAGARCEEQSEDLVVAPGNLAHRITLPIGDLGPQPTGGPQPKGGN
jgi:hypothetical protein